jgi:hypothetical protein
MAKQTIPPRHSSELGPEGSVEKTTPCRAKMLVSANVYNSQLV